MKLPSSSSIFLATVAISSSSTCLAAPTGEPNPDVLAASASVSQLSPTSTAPTPHAGQKNVDNASGDDMSDIRKRDDIGASLANTVSGVPILGSPLASAILHTLAVQTGNSSGGISGQDLAALQASAQEVSRVINANSLPAPIPSAVGGMTSMLPVSVAGVMSAGDPSTSGAGPTSSISSASAGPTQAAEEVGGQSASAASTSAYSSEAPPSPSPPVNPPNTPVSNLPVNV